MTTQDELARLYKSTKTDTSKLVPLLPPPGDRLTVPDSKTPHLGQARPMPLGQRLADLGWRCETFVLPAAFPRTTQTSARRSGDAPQSKETLRGKLDVPAEVARLYRQQGEAPKVNAEDKGTWQDQEPLVTTVNRYFSTRQSGSNKQDGLTLVLAHANGFMKETWEPTLAELLERLDPSLRSSSMGGLPVDEVWSLDCVNQGDAALLNENNLGDSFVWADNGRDILNFIISFLPPAETSEQPTDATHFATDGPAAAENALKGQAQDGLRFLPRQDIHDPWMVELDKHPSSPRHDPAPTTLDVDVANRRWRKRRVVGVGHSLGGAGMAFAASALPSLFSAVILVDPVIPPPQLDREAATTMLVGGALTRKDTWPSREEAKAAFLKKDFFRQWDRRCLDAYIEFGLASTSKGVTLKCKKEHEALVFADPGASMSSRAFMRLPSIPSNLPVHFVFAADGRSVLSSGPMIGRVMEQVKHATMVQVDAGHLVPQEKPAMLADELVRFLTRAFPSHKSTSRAKL